MLAGEVKTLFFRLFITINEAQTVSFAQHSGHLASIDAQSFAFHAHCMAVREALQIETMKQSRSLSLRKEPITEGIVNNPLLPIFKQLQFKLHLALFVTK